MLTPIGWVGIVLFAIGFIVFMLMNFLVEFSEKNKGKFIATVAVWGVVCLALTVFSLVSSIVLK